MLATSTEIAADGCCVGKRGNVNLAGIIDLSDLTALVNYLTGGAYVLPCVDAANVDATGIVDLTDLTALVNYLSAAGYVLRDCPPGTVTDIDGNVYQTVTIGTQVWMASNLRVTHYSNGDSIPEVKDSTVWPNLLTGAFCDYHNDTGLARTYGRLYNWYAVHDSRTIAPVGWHVPSDAEWQTLVNYLGDSTNAGGALKEAGYAHWFDGNVGATNSSGFTGLPGGYRYGTGSCLDMTVSAYFWTATERDYTHAWPRILSAYGAGVYQIYKPKMYGLSVRCVKDTAPSPVTDIDGNVYQTVTIGTQTWMAANLKVTHYRNGDAIPNVTDNSAWLARDSGAYCNYNNDTTLGNTYGRIYNWLAVDDSRGLAPAGWHVASDGEWQTLITYLGGDVVAGDKLKEAGTVHWNSPNSGNNLSGFSGLPGGSRQYNGDFSDLGVYGVFMSSTETAVDFVWVRALYNATPYVQTAGAYKPYGFSVRCVKD